jgi:hypothetical protein
MNAIRLKLWKVKVWRPLAFSQTCEAEALLPVFEANTEHIEEYCPPRSQSAVKSVVTVFSFDNGHDLTGIVAYFQSVSTAD